MSTLYLTTVEAIRAYLKSELLDNEKHIEAHRREAKKALSRNNFRSISYLNEEMLERGFYEAKLKVLLSLIKKGDENE